MVAMGYNVLRPTSMASVYDRVVEIDGKLFKFQIKSVNKDLAGSKWTKVKTVKRGNPTYSVEDVDFFAIYLNTFNGWYFHKNEGKTTVFVSFRNIDNFAACLGTKS